MKLQPEAASSQHRLMAASAQNLFEGSDTLPGKYWPNSYNSLIWTWHDSLPLHYSNNTILF